MVADPQFSLETHAAKGTSVVLVGGWRNGEVVKFPAGMRTMQMPCTRIGEASAGCVPCFYEQRSIVTYNLIRFACNGVEIAVGAAEGLTPLDVMTAFVKCYEKYGKRETYA